MKIRKLNNRPCKTATIILDWIASKPDRNGNDHIVVKSEDGRYFTNFKSAWDKLDIPVESLEKGDKLEISYVSKDYNGKNYDNFIKVKFIERPSLVAALAKMPDDEKTEAQKLVDEIDV